MVHDYLQQIATDLNTCLPSFYLTAQNILMNSECSQVFGTVADTQQYRYHTLPTGVNKHSNNPVQTRWHALNGLNLGQVLHLQMCTQAARSNLGHGSGERLTGLGGVVGGVKSA